jgi:hypothetical protein
MAPENLKQGELIVYGSQQRPRAVPIGRLFTRERNSRERIV